MLLLTLLIINSGNVTLSVPEQPLVHQSLELHVDQKEVDQWTDEEHERVYSLLQRVAQTWKKQGIEQYMVYRHERSWEIIPYQNTSNGITRIWQQFVVLYRLMFGALTLTENEQNQIKEDFLNGQSDEEIAASPVVNDPFCTDAVIAKQRVLEGDRVNVLYNYAPVGEEKLHFLIVPKEHREKFTDLTREEYVEAQQLSQKVISQIKKTHEISEVFLFHKTGRDAGQTVPHWHTHIIFSASPTQTFWGKLTVLKNLFFRSSPMGDNELKEQVATYTRALQS